MTATFQPIEQSLRAQGYTAICGVDEAGRGPCRELKRQNLCRRWRQHKMYFRCRG
ncbi:MAG: hypothetical protein FWD06_06100 [Oscillospiraceae bacterium]|nr:hypothetical protein [Oscillospiraceae bacterium]